MNPLKQVLKSDPEYDYIMAVGSTQEGVGALHIAIDVGREERISSWELTEEELQEVIENKRIYVIQPALAPVYVMAMTPFEPEVWIKLKNVKKPLSVGDEVAVSSGTLECTGVIKYINEPSEDAARVTFYGVEINGYAYRKIAVRRTREFLASEVFPLRPITDVFVRFELDGEGIWWCKGKDFLHSGIGSTRGKALGSLFERVGLTAIEPDEEEFVE
jgi:transcription antitermination factor NusG